MSIFIEPDTRHNELREYIASQIGTDATIVLKEWLACSRRPHAICLAIVEVAEGSTRFPNGLGWYRTKHGLMDLAATARTFNAYALRRFAEKVPLPPRWHRDAPGDHVHRWYQLLNLGGWSDRDHDKMFDDVVRPQIAIGMIEDARWQVEQLAPWSPAFQNMTPDRKRDYIAKALSFGPELFKRDAESV